MWCFVSVGAFFLQMREETELLAWRNGSHDADTRLFRLPKICRNTFFSFFFFYANIWPHARQRSPRIPQLWGLSVHVSSPRLPAEEDAAFSCLKWKEVSRGVAKYTGDCFWLLRSRYEGLLTAARPLPTPVCLVPITCCHFSLIINNAASTLPGQQTPKWRQSALQILTMSKVTSRIHPIRMKKKKKTTRTKTEQQETFNEDASGRGRC